MVCTEPVISLGIKVSIRGVIAKAPSKHVDIVVDAINESFLMFPLCPLQEK